MTRSKAPARGLSDMPESGFRPDLVAIGFFLVVALVFYGSLLWTGYLSLTNSRLIPSYEIVGFDQFARLVATPRWRTACVNLVILGAFGIAGSLALGTLLAILLDRDVRAEGLLRSIFLHPLALSLVITGLAWRWLLDPVTGIQSVLRGLGWSSFHLDWLADPDTAIYALVVASIWRSSGLVMIIMLAGLRGVDTDIWKAIRLEGIPLWRAYAQIVLPSLKLTIASCIILLMADVVRSYDLVIALTKGGPGFSTDLPAKFAVDHFFGRANIGLASAASVVILGFVASLLVPYLLIQRKGRA
ncbi:carbohydrate ABC transporter permease [Antarcticirhabdus aurantiaca]|uniref:Sugar ABC transporter permease n=1 Tax=Antarcticirhabdus aurantiaca TaxID=2606717 RepID=A0ACD4NNV7_9HYPH|nr:sugar ABC transporter permease [Antarcticirhabdus aurantiaca]WAJ28414.1 sugar ABC transporter permease [Jeongeuplla avenae]